METKRANEKSSQGVVLPFVPRPLNPRVRSIKATYQPTTSSSTTKRKHPHPPVLVIERLDGSPLLSVNRVEAEEKS
jgi:hypothetical protein